MSLPKDLLWGLDSSWNSGIFDFGGRRSWPHIPKKVKAVSSRLWERRGVAATKARQAGAAARDYAVVAAAAAGSAALAAHPASPHGEAISSVPGTWNGATGHEGLSLERQTSWSDSFTENDLQ